MLRARGKKSSSSLPPRRCRGIGTEGTGGGYKRRLRCVQSANRLDAIGSVDTAKVFYVRTYGAARKCGITACDDVNSLRCASKEMRRSSDCCSKRVIDSGAGAPRGD